MKRNTILKCFFSVFLIAFICNFQACSPVRFSSLPAVEMDSGNGFGYGGKPNREFYHYVPDFTCEGKSVAQARLSIFENIVGLTENTFNKCESTNTSILLSEVQTSAFHDQVIGHRGNIFEFSREVPEAVPDLLIEAWCRVNLGGAKTAEILVNFDRKTNLAKSQITVGEGRSKIELNEPAQNTIREVHQFDVDYKIAETSLHIDKRNPATGAPGQFEGAITTTKFEGSLKNYVASCYMGGLLDSRLWPAQIVFDANASQIDFDAANSVAYVVEKPMAGGSFGSLFKWDLLNQKTSSLVTGNSTDGVRDFKLSPDNQFLVLRAVKSPAFEQVYKFTPADKTFLQLNSSAISSKQWPGSWMVVSGHYKISSDSKFVFYMDGTHDASDGDVEPWLYRVPADGGAPVLVNDVLPIGPDLNIYSYIDLANSNRVSYLAGDSTNPRLFLSNLESGDKQDITPNLTNGWHFNLNMVLQKQDSTNSFFATAEIPYAPIDITTVKNRVFQLSNQGQLLKTLEFHGRMPRMSALSRWYFSEPLQGSVYNPTGKPTVVRWDFIEFASLETNQKFTWPMAADTPWNFDTLEDGFLYWNTTTKKMMHTIIASGVSKELCASQLASTDYQKIYVIPTSQLAAGQLLIAISASGIGHVYQLLNSNNSCQLKNSFSVVPNSSLKFTLHESSQSLFLAETVNVSLFVSQTNLKLIPINGLPPMGITQTLRPGIESFEQHFMIPERNLLIVMTRDQFNGTKKIYKFLLSK